jgi:hypothetical protein
MGEHCCGSSQGRKGFGVFTHQHEQNVEMSKIKSRKLSDVMDKLSLEDRVIVSLEFNGLNKASNEVIANNHMLRSRILELDSQIEILSARIELVRLSSDINEAKRLTYFPRESQFTKIND